MIDDLDDRLRSAAFAYVGELTSRSGGTITRTELESLRFEGATVRLIAPRQGIWKPRFLTEALSFVTTYVKPGEPPPYEDAIGPDGYPRYQWRGADPLLHDNVAMRRAMQRGRPLLWLIGVAPGVYFAEFPVWLVGEEPEQRQFVVALSLERGDRLLADTWTPNLEEFAPARRYAEVVVRQRLHQRVFAGRVLHAYEYRCALCRLHRRELLDAAHIKEDAAGGPPIVPNGLAMCAIHHRAFDALVLTVRPDYTIEVRKDVLRERDGPTLLHALQGIDHQTITVPLHRNERPDRDLLEERYERFRAAG